MDELELDWLDVELDELDELDEVSETNVDELELDWLDVELDELDSSASVISPFPILLNKKFPTTSTGDDRFAESPFLTLRPHPQTAPSSFNAIAAESIALILTKEWFPTTETGDVLLVVELSPSCPLEFAPHAQSVPFDFKP